VRLLLAFLFCLFSAVAHGALVATGLTSGGDSTCDGPTASTASITPTSNSLVLACVVTEIATGTAVLPTLTGNGLTWVQVATQLATSNLFRVTLFRASGASPSAGAVSIAISANQANCTWGIGEFTGQDTSGTSGSGAIVQSVANAGTGGITSLVVNLAAFADSANAAFGCFGNTNNTAVIPGTGFTEMGTQASGGAASRAFIEADGNDTSVDASCGTSTGFTAIAAEIKAVAVTTRRRMVPPIQQFMMFDAWRPVVWHTQP
jgi:hypothetical protein